MTLESKLISAICAELQFRENLGQLCFIRNNTGAVKTGTRFYRFGKKGSSDILLFLSNGRTIFLEGKTEKGQLTISQQQFRDRVIKLGYEYVVIRNVRELDNILAKKVYI